MELAQAERTRKAEAAERATDRETRRREVESADRACKDELGERILQLQEVKMQPEIDYIRDR